MKKTYTEFVPERVVNVDANNTKIIPAHNYTVSYDTKNIKKDCVDCRQPINPNLDLERNYLIRGNYCPPCAARYY